MCIMGRPNRYRRDGRRSGATNHQLANGFDVPPNRWWVDPGLFETSDTGNSGDSPRPGEAYEG